MTKRSFKFLFVVSMLLIAGLPVFAMGAMESVRVDNDTAIGDYLADSNHRTLYIFSKDMPGVSNWAPKAGSSDAWPAFYTDDLSKLPGGLSPADFGTITRSDGSLQTTFRGYPLYYFKGDMKARDINGDGKNDVWFTVDPYVFHTEAVSTDNAPDYSGE